MSMPERPLYAVVPIESEPFLLAPAIEFAHAKSKSWFKDIRQWYVDLPSSEQPFKSLAKMLGDVGMTGKTIGVEDSAAIAVIQKEMPGTTLVNARDIVRDLRMIKSKVEIDLMKDRGRYADFAMEIVKESVREGVTELEIVGKAVHETLSKIAKEVQETNGPMPIDVRVVAGPRSEFPHAYSTTRKLKRGDMIDTVVIASAYGYECGEIGRTLFFGEPSEEQKKVYQIALKGMEVARGALKPGAIAGDVHKARMEYLKGLGYANYIRAKTGALRGLETRDDVYLYESDQTVIRPGMTFAVNAGLSIPGHNGYRIGDLFLVTEKGNEPLTQFSSDAESVTIRT
jgi:Xaa-Pro dipeptidase